MQLADSKERHYVAIQIVDDFDRRGLFVKEHLRAAREHFDIRLVFGEDRDDLVGNSVFAADIGDRTFHVDGYEKFLRRAGEGVASISTWIEAFVQGNSRTKCVKVNQLAGNASLEALQTRTDHWNLRVRNGCITFLGCHGLPEARLLTQGP
jgi:hypothetical protein